MAGLQQALDDERQRVRELETLLRRIVDQVDGLLESDVQPKPQQAFDLLKDLKRNAELELV